MSIATNSKLVNGSLWNPKIDFKGCVFYAPLWHPTLGGTSFKSKDTIGHTCTVTGAVWTPQGRTFDGDDFIEVANNVALDILGDITIMAWVKTTSLADNNRVFFRGATNTEGYAFWIGGTGALWYTTYQAGAAQNSNTAAGTIVTDTWYHIAVTRTGTTAIIYKNGVSVSLSTVGEHIDPVTSVRTAKIGRHEAGTEYLIGTGGELFIYNRLLSAGEISRNQQLTKWRYQ